MGEFYQNLETPRQQKLRGYVDYFADAMEAEDKVPANLVKRSSHDEDLFKVQDNFFLDIHLQLVDIINPVNALILDPGHLDELKKGVDEIIEMIAESRILEHDLTADDSLGEAGVFNKKRELRQNQVYILNGIILKTIRILEAERKADYGPH